METDLETFPSAIGSHSPPEGCLRVINGADEGLM